MLDDRLKMLTATMKKLYHRDAKTNLEKIITKSHPADIAAILENFEPGERFDLFKMEPSLDKRSEILSHLSNDLQTEIMSCLSRAEVINLVNSMDTDDAADLLGHLPGEEANEILSSMKEEDSDEVSDLMGYPEDSAGGIMSLDFLSVNQMKTVQETIQFIHDEEEDLGASFYIYVVNDANKLVGVVSLKQLILSKKSTLLKELMLTDVISVSVDSTQELVAKTVEHYDYLSLPVVDSSNCLVGVVTVDDVIDVIREEAEEDLLALGQAGLGIEANVWERFRDRFYWLLFAYFGGVSCFAVVYAFRGTLSEEFHFSETLWLGVSCIPVILSMGALTGGQTATVMVGALRGGRLTKNQFLLQVLNEFKLSFLFAIPFTCLSFGLLWFLSKLELLSLYFSIVIGFQIIVSMLVGSMIPLLLEKINVDPTMASIPVFAAITDLTAMLILFGGLSQVL